MKNRSYIKYLAFVVCLVIAYSCNDFKDYSSNNFMEADKNLSGTWKIVKATRNGQDLTTMMDFSNFKLNLETNGTYSIDNYIPFLVRNNGEWAIDDPKYPFRLMFKENTSSEPLISVLNYPVVSGIRQISLTFSPGCYNNVYTYVFVEDSNNH